MTDRFTFTGPDIEDGDQQGDTDSGCDNAHAVIVFAEEPKPEFASSATPNSLCIGIENCHIDYLTETIRDEVGGLQDVIHIVRGLDITQVSDLEDYLSSFVDGNVLDDLRAAYPDLDENQIMRIHAANMIRDEVREFLSFELGMQLPPDQSFEPSDDEQHDG